MTRALIAWGPAVAWATVLFLVSESGVIRPVVWFAVNDKIVHLGLYGVLGATLGWGRRWSDPPVPHWALIGIGLLYAVLDELHQSFVPGRVPSVADFVADAIGLVVGYTLVLVSWAAFARARPSRIP